MSRTFSTYDEARKTLREEVIQLYEAYEADESKKTLDEERIEWLATLTRGRVQELLDIIDGAKVKLTEKIMGKQKRIPDTDHELMDKADKIHSLLIAALSLQPVNMRRRRFLLF